MRKSMIAWSLMAVIALAACSRTPAAPQPTAPATQEPTAATVTVVTVEIATVPANTPYPAPENGAYPAPTSQINEATMQAMSELARQKLAEELEIPVDQILVVSADPTNWSDASLGCPQPGTTYQQVITPGYRITLVVEGDLYIYHTDTVETVIRCQQ